MAFETTLPGRYFYDPEIYAREQERLFGQMWTCVGRADALPDGGRLQDSRAGRGERAHRARPRRRAARLPQRLPPPRSAPQPGAVWQHRRRHPVHVPRLVLRAGRPPHRRSQHRPRRVAGSGETRTRPGSSRRLGRAHLALAGRRSSSGRGPARAGAARPFRRAGEIPALRRRVARGREIDHLRHRRQLEAGRRELHGVLPLRSGPSRADQPPPRFPPRHLLSGDRRAGHRVRRRDRRLHPLRPR